MPVREDPVELAVDGRAIAGTFVIPRRRMPGVLFVHGWGGSQAQYRARARALATRGCVCLTFDLTGHAATQPLFETVSREQNLRDVVSAYDLLCSHRNVDPEQIAVVGSSYGGYLSAILTARRAVRWLVLRVPALYVDSDWEMPKLKLRKAQNLVVYRQSFVPAAENRALRDCANFTGDVLVVESEFDDLIPHTVIESYLEAFVKARSKTWRLVSGADHGLTDERCQQAYTSLLLDWFSEVVFVGAKANAFENQAAAAASHATLEVPPTRVE